MNRVLQILLFTALLLLLPLHAEVSGEKAADFAAKALSRIEEKPSVKGEAEGWFFLVRELRHLATAEFWEKPWEEVAKNQSDPVASIVEFHHLLEERGKQLILVPVPAKGRVYPDKLDSHFSPGEVTSLTPFIEKLRENGLQVMDLYSALLKARDADDSVKYYCAQDAHFSPETIELLAELIAAEVGVQGSPVGDFQRGGEEKLWITGDQIAGSEWENQVAEEELRIDSVVYRGERGVTPDPESPYLLLGDSHTLVFHQGKEAGMHSTGAGLVDHLSLRFDRRFDLVGVRGSGLVQARKQLFYRATSEPGFWDKKQLVVWVFSEREFTQSSDRLISIPLDR